MKRFVFRLQTLLNHRKDVEQMLLGELAQHRLQEQSELARLDQLVSDRQRSWDALSHRMHAAEVTGASSWDLANGDEYCKALGDDIGLQELTLAAARREVEAKLAEVVEAAKERKVLEQLCEKQRREHELEAARLEQTQLDEMSSVRFARGMV